MDNLNSRFKKVNKYINNTNSLLNLVKIALEIDCLKPKLNKLGALIRRDIIQNKKHSWQTYVTKFPETPSQKKLWEKFRKINGSFSYSQRSPLLYNGRKFFDPKDISSIIGRHLESVGNSLNEDVHFRKKKNIMLKK